jgi:hypothetical protein
MVGPVCVLATPAMPAAALFWVALRMLEVTGLAAPAPVRSWFTMFAAPGLEGGRTLAPGVFCCGCPGN